MGVLPTDRLTRGHFAVLGLLAMLAPLATSFYLPGLPELGTDLGVSVPQAQLTVSATLIGLALGAGTETAWALAVRKGWAGK